jgi:hypothetical protein
VLGPEGKEHYLLQPSFSKPPRQQIPEWIAVADLIENYPALDFVQQVLGQPQIE